MLRRLFAKRIAQKIYLGLVLPLAVLLVAGILVPIFVWISLESYQSEYLARAALVQKVEQIRHAAIDTQAAALSLAREDTPARRSELLRARDEFRDASIEVGIALEDAPLPAVRDALRRSEQAFRPWYRQVQLGNRRASFDPIRPRLDELVGAAGRARDQAAPAARRAEMLRRTTALVVPVLAVLLSLLLGRTIAQGIARPLEELNRAARGLAAGDAPTALPERLPDDELGDLQRTFTEMSGIIRQRESDLLQQNDTLTDTRRRIEAVLNATNDGIVLLSKSGIISLVNERFAYFFGLEPADLHEIPFEKVRPHLLSRFTSREQVLERLKAVLRDPEMVAEDTFDLLHPSVRTVRLFTAPVREGEELLGRIVVLRDVTRETQVDRMKSEFVSTVSHELRTPLTAIQGYVDLILEGKPGPLTETQREFLTMMQSSSQRLTALITDILDISRIEAGKIEIREDDVAYPPLVELIVRMLQGEAQARGVTLQAQIPSEKCPLVRGDTERLQQVLTNLISNGIKYTPPGGEITVTVGLQESYIATCVADTGIGIPMEDREKVFEKFYRADNSTTRQAGGTGLGLAIARAIVERLGGSIWVESEPGQGSRFWFTLPLPDSESADSPEKREPLGQNDQLYLVAGSDTGALHRIAHALRPQGIIASAAATPAEAHRRTRGLRPDALLLDVLSEGFDARAFLTALRSDLQVKRQPPVFLYTLRYDIAAAELRDPLALTAFPAHDAARLGFEATLTAALKDAPTLPAGRAALVAVLGDETFTEALAPLRRQGATLLSVPSAEEADRRLGPLIPTLLIVDARRPDAPLQEAGTLLRRCQSASREGRLPVLLVVEPGDILLTPDIRPLLPLGGSPLPVERLARAVRESTIASE